jgi:aerobic-type carbon monoxide dehydrogenase small subunit (CoxS/CutS family)
LPTPLNSTLIVNGQTQTISVADETEDLLYVLRDKLNLIGPRFGCGVAQCGCCTVIVNGAITRSCITPMTEVPDGSSITTLDGISKPGKPHPLQQAFIDEQAGQCAYCCNSMIMGAYGWLESRIADGNTAVPTDQEIKDFYSGNGTTPPYDYLCRCGAHLRIIAAIKSAAKVMVGGVR